MKPWRWVAALLLLTGCVNVSVEAGKKHSGATTATIADSTLAPAIDAFAVDLYRKLAAEQGNLLFSPLSISTVLASLVPGAVGTTQAEMLRVLHLTGPASYRSFMAGLDERAHAGGAQWTMANRAWVQSGLELSPGYVSATRDGFGYDIGQADFERSPEPSRMAINQWVEQKTQSRIQDLFPAGSIDASMRLVLANAIYFKGFWDSQFPKMSTSAAPFHLSAQQNVDVPMMSQAHRFGLRQIPGAHVLELPYRGGKLSMLVILPDTVDGLPALERQISATAIREWSNPPQAEVLVNLPRFTFTQHFRLDKALMEMGMPTAFQDTADFSAMTGKRELFLGIVVHGAFVDVNEEGTEAAAATGAGLETESVQVPEMFTADHPFLFLIRDRETGCILFMGRVMDPRG